MVQNLPALSAQSPAYLDSFEAVLLALTSSPVFSLSEAQLALSTLDGLTEVLEWNNQGQAADEVACIWLSHLRWYARTGRVLSSSAPFSLARPLDSLLPSGGSAPADPATLLGLAEPDMQLLDRNLHKDQDGPGALVRALPLGLLPVENDQTVVVLAAKTAALTNGAPTAITAASALALLLRAALALRGQQTPLASALAYTAAWAKGLGENSSLPGDGAGLAEALTTGEASGAGSLTALAKLAQALRAYEGGGQLPASSSTPEDILHLALVRSLVGAAYGSQALKITPAEGGQAVQGLLTSQWQTQLGLA